MLALVAPYAAMSVYAFVALLWLVPDRRIEKSLEQRSENEPPTGELD